jgi:selenoprotein W-related protein
VQERLGLEAELIRGSGGVFEVRLDDELVFSKKALRRFPEPGEVEGILAARL